MDAKPLFIVLIFVFILAIIASGIIGNVDLTDSGVNQQMLQATAPGGTTLINPDVFQSNADPSQPSLLRTNGGQPITGVGKSTSPYNSPCGSYYIVQSGDTLSSISRTCLISVEDLLATNPSITNQHLIAVGQRIIIYNTNLPVVTPLPQVTLFPPIATLPGGPPATLAPGAGLRQGDPVPVNFSGFSPGAQVRVGLGRYNDVPTSITSTRAGPDGVVSLVLQVPLHANPGETWVVTAVTTSGPAVRKTGTPFPIIR